MKTHMRSIIQLHRIKGKEQKSTNENDRVGINGLNCVTFMTRQTVPILFSIHFPALNYHAYGSHAMTNCSLPLPEG